MFGQIKKDKRTSLIFIENTNTLLKTRQNIYVKYGQAYLWNNFKDAYHLLSSLEITKVIFLHFGDYNEIAIRVACKKHSINTFMLSHGVSFPDQMERQNQIDLNTNKLWKNKLKNNFAVRSLTYFKNVFYRNTVNRSKKNDQKFLKTYYKTRAKNTMLDSFKKINHSLLKLDFYIAFNRNNKNWFIKKHHININNHNKILLTGFPSFDVFYKLNADYELNSSSILFIDQPFYEKSLFGWEISHKKKLFNYLLETGKQILIKPHPLCDLSFWKEYPQIKIISDEEDFLTKVVSTSIIIGFNSTLLLPLCALKNKAVFALETHPLPQKKPYFSDFLTTSGVAKQITSLNQLKGELLDTQKLIENQNKFKPQFCEEWLHKFDGNSTQRLTDILLD